MEQNELEYCIDVDQILKDKMGEKSKYVPKFLVSWLKKILHQDDLNVFLATTAKGQYGPGFLDAAVKHLKLRLNVQTNIKGEITQGLDKLPNNEDGRYFTIVCNHPLGGPDGVILGSVICHKYDGKMVYLINDFLMNFKGLAPLSVPINKTGAQSRSFPKLVEAAFQMEKNVVMFPAGLCSRKQDDGTIKDLEWKKTFITKSVQYKRDIIPVHFSGQNSDRFYSIARWCKRLHLKFNFAMLFLSDEMFKNAGKEYTLTFGEPIPWQTFDKSKTPIEWAQWVKEQVYSL